MKSGLTIPAGLAAAVLACGPSPADRRVAEAGEPTAGDASAWFVEAAGSRGLAFVHDSGERGEWFMPEIMGSGVALFDKDGDGDLDVYAVQCGAVRARPDERPPNRLFENDGAGRFLDVTESSGAGDRGVGMGVACGDADGDGDPDLYVTNVGPDVLLLNDGTGRFDRAARPRTGGFSTSATFFDADLDGDLDLYVCRYLSWKPDQEIECVNPHGGRDYCDPAAYEAPAFDVLLRNVGGRFVDASEESGVAARAATGLGVAAGDFDDDGDLDLFVANDGMGDFLWVNDGSGRFVEEGLLRAVAVDSNGTPKAGMGVGVADLDDDGDLDLLVGNLGRETDSLHRNDGGVFSDATPLSGLGPVSRPFTRFGLVLADFDLDGLLDLYEAAGRVRREAPLFSEDPYAEPNLLLRSQGPLRFVEVKPRGGVATPLLGTSRGAAGGDVDGDGDPDVVVVDRGGPLRLLLDRRGDGRAWVGFLPVERSGAPALHARVLLERAGRTMLREVRVDGSYLSASEPVARFGLGDDRSPIRRVVVVWPGGRRTEHGPFETGRVHRIVRPD